MIYGAFVDIWFYRSWNIILGGRLGKGEASDPTPNSTKAPIFICMCISFLQNHSSIKNLLKHQLNSTTREFQKYELSRQD